MGVHLDARLNNLEIAQRKTAEEVILQGEDISTMQEDIRLIKWFAGAAVPILLAILIKLLIG